jgi:aminoglycoside phosphotransferase (APT) family kinase protein
MSGPPRPRPDVRVRRHLAWFVPEAGGIVLDASGRLPVQVVGWRFPPDVDDLVWPGAAPGAVATLTCLSRVEVAGEPVHDDRVVLVEPVPGGAEPSYERVWRGDGDAPDALPEPLVAALRAWLAEATGRSTPDPGWPAFAWPGGVAALAAAVGRAGAGALGPGTPGGFVQQRAWSLSTVWASDTAFLKAPTGEWASEGPVTAALARLSPDRVPQVLGHGLTHHGQRPLPWMVQRRQEGESRDGEEAIATLAATMGELVRRTAPHLDDLRAAGLADRRPAAVAAELPVIWASAELDALSADERARLPELEARVRSRLADVAARGAPSVLAHGDLHAGNALFAPDGRVWIIDWTDAAVSWPGADLLTMVGLNADLDGAALHAVANAYREAAGPALSAFDADALLAGARAGLVFHALAYARIAAAAPAAQRWQLEGAVRYLVRRLLQLEGLAA